MYLKYNEMLQKMHGVISLIPSHFKADESLDLEAVKKTAEYVCKQYKTNDGALILGGSFSEFCCMTDYESLKVIATVVKQVNCRLPVIAETGRSATGLTIEMTKNAQDLGIDCAIVSTPQDLQISTKDLFKHFSKIAESVDVGIIINNNCTTSKREFSPKMITELSKIPNIIGFIGTITSMEKYQLLTSRINPNECAICCCIEELKYMHEPFLRYPTILSELVCIAPNIMFDLYDAAINTDWKKVDLLNRQLIPYNNFVAKCFSNRKISSSLELCGRTSIVYQSIIKQSMSLRGLSGGPVRKPLDNISAKEIAELKIVLNQIGSI